MVICYKRILRARRITTERMDNFVSTFRYCQYSFNGTLEFPICKVTISPKGEGYQINIIAPGANNTTVLKTQIGFEPTVQMNGQKLILSFKTTGKQLIEIIFPETTTVEAVKDEVARWGKNNNIQIDLYKLVEIVKEQSGTIVEMGKQFDSFVTNISDFTFGTKFHKQITHSSTLLEEISARQTPELDLQSISMENRFLVNVNSPDTAIKGVLVTPGLEANAASSSHIMIMQDHQDTPLNIRKRPSTQTCTTLRKRLIFDPFSCQNIFDKKKCQGLIIQNNSKPAQMLCSTCNSGFEKCLKEDCNGFYRNGLGNKDFICVKCHATRVESQIIEPDENQTD